MAKNIFLSILFLLLFAFQTRGSIYGQTLSNETTDPNAKTSKVNDNQAYLLSIMDETSKMSLQHSILFFDNISLSMTYFEQHPIDDTYFSSSIMAGVYAARCYSGIKTYSSIWLPVLIEIINSDETVFNRQELYFVLNYNAAYILDGSLSEKDNYLKNIVNASFIDKLPNEKIIAICERGIIYFYAEKYEESEKYLYKSLDMFVDYCTENYSKDEMARKDYILLDKKGRTACRLKYLFKQNENKYGLEKFSRLIEDHLSSYPKGEKNTYAIEICNELLAGRSAYPIHVPIGAEAQVGKNGGIIYGEDFVEGWMPSELEIRTADFLEKYSDIFVRRASLHK